jgi:hypothetical protein
MVTMRIRMLNRYWKLRFTCLLFHRGDCDAPTRANKEIRIDTRLHGEERLEVLIHEFLHAAAWHLDETFVDNFARDTARTLWRVDYRLCKEPARP